MLARALARGLHPIVVVNKVDRPSSRIDEAMEPQDLFLELATDADQLEFPVLFAIAREGAPAPSPIRPSSLQTCGRCSTRLCARCRRRTPTGGTGADLVASLDYDPHRGRIAIGRVHRGTINAGDKMVQLGDREETRQRVSSLTVFDGLRRVKLPRRAPGRSSPWPGFQTSASAPRWPTPMLPTRCM